MEPLLMPGLDVRLGGYGAMVKRDPDAIGRDRGD